MYEAQKLFQKQHSSLLVKFLKRTSFLGTGGGTYVTNLFLIGCVQRYKLPQVAWFKIP